MVRLVRLMSVAAALAGVGVVIGCGSSSTTATSGKMGSDKMGSDKMGSDKMGSDKMSTSK